MTVKELIEKLKKLPPTSTVYFRNGEYLEYKTPVRKVLYQEKSAQGSGTDTVTIA